MTRMTGPDCVVMCNLINTYIHTYCYFNDSTKQYVVYCEDCKNKCFLDAGGEFVKKTTRPTSVLIYGKI